MYYKACFNMKKDELFSSRLNAEDKPQKHFNDLKITHIFSRICI